METEAKDVIAGDHSNSDIVTIREDITEQHDTEPGEKEQNTDKRQQESEISPTDKKTEEGGENKEASKTKNSPQTVCKLCGVTFNSDIQAEAHFNGKRHKSLLNGSKVASNVSEPMTPKKQANIICNLCSVSFNGSIDAIEHFNDIAHQLREKKALETLAVKNPTANADSGKNQFSCEVCNLTFNSMSQVVSHKSGRKHKSKEKNNQIATHPGVPSQAAGVKRVASDYWVETMPASKLKSDGRKGHVTSGTLSTTDLPLVVNNTSLLQCDICNITVNSKDQLEKHLNGVKHKLNSGSLLDPPDWWIEREKNRAKDDSVKNQAMKCVICNISVNSLDQLTAHMQGKVHKFNKERLKQGGGKPPLPPPPMPPPLTSSFIPAGAGHPMPQQLAVRPSVWSINKGNIPYMDHTPSGSFVQPPIISMPSHLQDAGQGYPGARGPGGDQQSRAMIGPHQPNEGWGGPPAEKSGGAGMYRHVDPQHPIPPFPGLAPDNFGRGQAKQAFGRGRPSRGGVNPSTGYSC